MINRNYDLKPREIATSDPDKIMEQIRGNSHYGEIRYLVSSASNPIEIVHELNRSKK